MVLKNGENNKRAFYFYGNFCFISFNFGVFKIMFYFIKPKTVLKFPKDHRITEFNKVEYSKESNQQFNEVLKLWQKSHKEIRKKSEVKK